MDVSKSRTQTGRLAFWLCVGRAVFPKSSKHGGMADAKVPVVLHPLPLVMALWIKCHAGSMMLSQKEECSSAAQLFCENFWSLCQRKSIECSDVVESARKMLPLRPKQGLFILELRHSPYLRFLECRKEEIYCELFLCSSHFSTLRVLGEDKQNFVYSSDGTQALSDSQCFPALLCWTESKAKCHDAKTFYHRLFMGRQRGHRRVPKSAGARAWTSDWNIIPIFFLVSLDGFMTIHYWSF